MQFDYERPRLGYRGSLGSRAQNLIVKVLAIAGAGVMLISAIALSIVLFAVAATAVMAFGIYFWWKVRRMRQAGKRARWADGNVIEGVIIREASKPPERKR